MVSCLLTTQQRSGPKSPVTRFALTEPFPLAYDLCRQRRGQAAFVSKKLTEFRGIRRAETIGREVAANASVIEAKWDEISSILETVRRRPSPKTERQAARYFDEHLKGFGPKQSRNRLQWLGLNRFEVPIDSRITKWLNELGFPVTLTAAALADRGYYEFVSDGLRKLTAACDVVPCVLDAAVFSSFDD
jgi:hypothetical protein